MRREEVELFLNKRVRIIADFGNNNPVFYTGNIKTVNDSSLILLDKFDSLVSISLDSIKKMEEWRE